MNTTLVFSSIQNMQSCYLLVCNLHDSNSSRTQGGGHRVTGECAKRDYQGREWKNPVYRTLPPWVLTKHSPGWLPERFVSKTMKISGVKGYVRSQTSSVFSSVITGWEKGMSRDSRLYKKEYERGRHSRDYSQHARYRMESSLSGLWSCVTFCSTINAPCLAGTYHSTLLVCSVVTCWQERHVKPHRKLGICHLWIWVSTFFVCWKHVSWFKTN